MAYVWGALRERRVLQFYLFLQVVVRVYTVGVHSALYDSHCAWLA